MWTLLAALAAAEPLPLTPAFTAVDVQVDYDERTKPKRAGEAFGGVGSSQYQVIGTTPYGLRMIRSWGDDDARGRFHARTGAARLPPVDRSTLDSESQYPLAEGIALAELTALGLDPDQFGHTVARYLNAEPLDQPGAMETHEIIVWVQRSVSGVDVAGHRAAVVLDLNNEVRSIRATWPVLDADRSTWNLPVTGRCSLDELARWVEEEIEPMSSTAITLSPLLIPDEEWQPGACIARVDRRTVAKPISGLPGGIQKRHVLPCEPNESEAMP